MSDAPSGREVDMREGAAGVDMPDRGDRDGLTETFTDNHVTVRAHSRGFDVSLRPV